MNVLILIALICCTMPNLCSVKNCGNKSHESVSVFRLPVNQASAQKWLDFLSKGGKIVQLGKQYQICEIHFVPSWIKNTSDRKTLLPGAFPSIWNVS
jgi:THAP domain